MTKKTWDELFASLAGYPHDEEVPDGLEPASEPMVSARHHSGPQVQSSSPADDPTELWRQLADGQRRQSRFTVAHPVVPGSPPLGIPRGAAGDRRIVPAVVVRLVPPAQTGL